MRKKRKKSRVVEKMEVDEKGYLVTKMVTEEYTDDEPSPVKSQPVKPKSSGQTINFDGDDTSGSSKREKPAPAPTKKKVIVPVSQKSISSFFGAKK